MDLYGTFQKKSAAKSNAERAWQTTVNKDSTIVRNQRPSSNDRNIYLAFLPMRQRQDTMLGYHAHSKTCEKKERIRSMRHTLSWNPLTESNRQE